MKNSKFKKLFLVFILVISLFATNVYADDYTDDVYDGDYSVKEMLENYNVVTFGKKELDSHINKSNFTAGGSKVFHINGHFLVNGLLDAGRIDDEGNANLKSYFKSITTNPVYCGYTEGSGTYELHCSVTNGRAYSMSGSPIKVKGGYYGNNTTVAGNYMNFDRLYESITEEQNKIKKGRLVTSEAGVAHIETGGEYYIDDINEINSIMFDNFAENENKLTVITINNSGAINFPKLYEAADNGEGTLVPTNDTIGMTRPNDYYAEYFVTDKYYGNIVWNIPNATYIELPSAPFIGHVIAPNADLYGPELHFAGSFIVNSLYIEGNGEAHNYPLTLNIPYKSNEDPVKAIPEVDEKQGSVEFNNGVNPDELEEGMVVSFKVNCKDDYLLSDLAIKDEEGNTIEFRKIGDNEYEFTMPATDVTITPVFREKNPIDIIINPETGSKLVLIIATLTIVLGSGLLVYKKKGTKIKI